MPKTITLKRDAVCTDCGAALPAGTQARYYDKEKIYCPGEHAGKAGAPAAPPPQTGAPPPLTRVGAGPYLHPETGQPAVLIQTAALQELMTAWGPFHRAMERILYESKG